MNQGISAGFCFACSKSCKNQIRPKFLGSHRRFRVWNLLCDLGFPGQVLIGEIRRCRFDKSGPCDQLLSGSNWRFRVRNLLCGASPIFGDQGNHTAHNMDVQGPELPIYYVGPPRFSETAGPLEPLGPETQTYIISQTPPPNYSKYVAMVGKPHAHSI